MSSVVSSVNIAILAGGQSSRMGTDKSLLRLHDKPIFEHILARLAPLGLPIMLITNSPEKYAQYGLPMTADIMPDHGSLGGLYTALASSSTDYSLCVACDMPLLNTTLLRYLIERRTGWDIVVPRIGPFPEALHAVYSKACLDPMHDQLLKGQLKASGFYDQMKTCYIEEVEIRRIDPDLHSFINVNTPHDFDLLNQLK